MAPKRILVTGAAGFVGAALCRRLAALGHEVHAVSRSGALHWRLAGLARDLRIHETDLRDEASVAALAASARPEAVFHLATHGAYPTQTDADGIIETNILGSWNLLKALAKTDYECFVNTGSSSEYGFKQYAMRESDILEPNSYYAVAKCAQTLLCQHYARAEKRPITTFRLFSVYGPYEEPSRLVPTLVRNCLTGQPLDLVAPEIARDFVYIDDVIDAYLCFDRLSALRGEIVNIGTGVQSTIGEVAKLVLQHTGAQVETRVGRIPARIWDQSTWVADCTQARRLLGWQPRTVLSDGLLATVRWAQAREQA